MGLLGVFLHEAEMQHATFCSGIVPEAKREEKGL